MFSNDCGMNALCKAEKYTDPSMTTRQHFTSVAKIDAEICLNTIMSIDLNKLISRYFMPNVRRAERPLYLTPLFFMVHEFLKNLEKTSPFLRNFYRMLYNFLQ